MDKVHHLIQQFYDHPDWKHVETVINDYADKLLDMNDVDLSAPAEHIKAELIGRTRSHKLLCEFLADSKISSRKLTAPSNPFK